jgi:hypothetical protein
MGDIEDETPAHGKQASRKIKDKEKKTNSRSAMPSSEFVRTTGKAGQQRLFRPHGVQKRTHPTLFLLELVVFQGSGAKTVASPLALLALRLLKRCQRRDMGGLGGSHAEIRGVGDKSGLENKGDGRKTSVGKASIK